MRVRQRIKISPKDIQIELSNWGQTCQVAVKSIATNRYAKYAVRRHLEMLSSY